MSRILIIEDDANLLAALADYLGREGFEIARASSFKEASATTLDDIDAVVLDWMLPDGHGIELLRSWRANDIAVPVIMLTARADLIDKVLGLELGADDYLTKPFEPRELLARLRARLRTLRSPKKIIELAGIAIDREAQEVIFRGRKIELTRMEYRLLEIFVENPNKVFSRDELLNKVWGFDNYPSTRTVDTHMLQLRQKLAPELFSTVRGSGYRFDAKLTGP